MIKISKYTFLFLLFFLLIACSSKQNTPVSEKTQIEGKKNLAKSDIMYKKASDFLKEADYYNALIDYKILAQKYPLSKEGVQAQIMIAFIYYLQLDYNNAVYDLSKFITKYPSHENIDYAYYLLALSNYEQINNEELDGTYNVRALENFNNLINRFPKSKYTKDSVQKIILINENISAKHMNIGRFYQNQNKNIAALNRYKTIVREHSSSKFVPEALYRMVEIYFKLGLEDDAIKSASTIGFNYPDSKWYKYAYNLVNKENINKNGISIPKKIKNFFKINEPN
jgi:outer membrane protein assembly factor BamD